MTPRKITEDKESEQFNAFLKGCINLAGNPDFTAIKIYLQTRLFSISLGYARTADEVKTRWDQGRAQELQTLLGWMRPEFAQETLLKRTAPPATAPKID